MGFKWVMYQQRERGEGKETVRPGLPVERRIIREEKEPTTYDRKHDGGR